MLKDIKISSFNYLRQPFDPIIVLIYKVEIFTLQTLVLLVLHAKYVHVYIN